MILLAAKLILKYSNLTCIAQMIKSYNSNASKTLAIKTQMELRMSAHVFKIPTTRLAQLQQNFKVDAYSEVVYKGINAKWGLTLGNIYSNTENDNFFTVYSDGTILHEHVNHTNNTVTAISEVQIEDLFSVLQYTLQQFIDNPNVHELKLSSVKNIQFLTLESISVTETDNGNDIVFHNTFGIASNGQFFTIVNNEFKLLSFEELIAINMKVDTDFMESELGTLFIKHPEYYKFVEESIFCNRSILI